MSLDWDGTVYDWLTRDTLSTVMSRPVSIPRGSICWRLFRKRPQNLQSEVQMASGNCSVVRAKSGLKVTMNTILVLHHRKDDY